MRKSQSLLFAIGMTITMLVGSSLIGMVAVPQTVMAAQAIDAEDDMLNSPQVDSSTVVNQSGNVFTFEELGFSEKMMVGPYSAVSILFSTPEDWQLIEGGKITLTYTFIMSGFADERIGSPTNWIGGTLLVIFNNQVLETIVLNGTGEHTIEVPIVGGSLNPGLTDGRHNLRLFLDASIDCDYEDVQTTVMISSQSKVDLHYQAKPLTVTLARFPRPIYQLNGIVPSKAIIVLPDDPTSAELQAGLTVAAGMGSISFGELDLEFKTYTELSSDDFFKQHMILVGLATSFPVLIGMDLPMMVTSEGLQVPERLGEVGVVQFTTSPWTLSKAMLFVSGNSDAALIKAAQTVSTGVVVANPISTLSLIDAVNPETAAQSIVEDMTLAELGYASETVQEIGENYLSYSFFVAPEQVAAEGAYFEMISNHSRLLDYDSTGMTVFLNGEIVGSERFEEDRSQITTTRIEFLPKTLRPGENMLEIMADIHPFYDCYSAVVTSTWFTVSNRSALHLPAAVIEEPERVRLNLDSYPWFLLDKQSMEGLGFVLAQDDPDGWRSAADIAFFIGTVDTAPVAGLSAAYVDELSEEVRTDRNLLLVGRASTLGIISELNSVLPAPYTDNSDLAVQPAMRVNYSLPDGVNVGYLQLVASPWNPDKGVLIAGGNTITGVTQSGVVLSDLDQASQLKGNFAVIYGEQILSVDTRFSVVRDTLISELPMAVTLTPTPMSTDAAFPEAEIEGLPSWLFPGVIVTTVTMLLILIYLFLSSRKKRVVMPEKQEFTELE